VLDVAAVAALHREIVDRGLREKASHAIRLCAGTAADALFTEAFA
jgi:hypothetical protein